MRFSTAEFLNCLKLNLAIDDAVEMVKVAWRHSSVYWEINTWKDGNEVNAICLKKTATNPKELHYLLLCYKNVENTRNSCSFSMCKKSKEAVRIRDNVFYFLLKNRKQLISNIRRNQIVLGWHWPAARLWRCHSFTLAQNGCWEEHKKGKEIRKKNF